MQLLQRHSVYRCKDFLVFAVSRRNSEIRNRKLYINCLRSTIHTASKCTSDNCRTCGAKHNTVLHATARTEVHDRDEGDKKEAAAAESPSQMVTHVKFIKRQVHCYPLRTLMITVIYPESVAFYWIADNFISRKFLTILGLKLRSLDPG